jgi:hypothetical protein
MANILRIKMLNEDYLNYKNNNASIIENNHKRNISNLEIFLENDILNIKWKDCEDENWVRNYVVKTENSIPEDIYNNPVLAKYTTKDKYFDQPFVDKDIKLNKLYYYRIFSEFNYDTTLYSGFKNIFIVYVENAEDNNDFAEQKRIEVINSLNSIQQPISDSAGWSEINNTIKSIEMDNNFIDCYLNGQIYKPPTYIDLQEDNFLNSFPFDFSNGISVNNGIKLLSPNKVSNNVYSFQLKSDDLSTIQSINSISGKFIDISTMNLLGQNSDYQNYYAGFSGNNFDSICITSDSQIILMSNNNNIYSVNINNSDGYCNKVYIQTLSDKFLIYWEGWSYYYNHSSKPIDKIWYASIDKDGNTTVYLVTTSDTSKFSTQKPDNNQINFPTIFNNTIYYCNITNNTVTSKGTFSTNINLSINKYLSVKLS